MSAQSGIKANENLSKTLAEAKNGSIRLVHMQIEDEQIKLRKTIPIQDTWENDFDKFIEPLLDSSSASYILYRLDSKNNLGYEWILLTWIPDSANIWQKTLYASSRATIRRQFGDGSLADDILCHDKEDISLAGYKRHLILKTAPTPLTNAESLSQEIEAGHANHSSLNDAYNSLGGVSFALNGSSVKLVKGFADRSLNYVQFRIDVPKEQIFVASSKGSLKPEEVAGLTPSNTGSYHLFRFSHDFEGQQCSSVVFLHAILGYKSSIKERMLYSSCKGNLIDSLTRDYGIDIQRKLEIEDFNDFTTEFLMESLHPKALAEMPLFLAKPKGPAGRGPRRLIK